MAEVTAHLERRGVDGEVVVRAIAILREQGYLDDRRFAARFAEDKRALQGWGARRIAARLRAKGVDGELAAAALAEEEDPGDDSLSNSEHGRARAVLARRFAGGIADVTTRRRALGMLLRKGYAPDLARAAVRAHTREG